jgi:hypothetical protein
MQLRAHRGGVAFDVAPGDVLRTGDGVELFIAVSTRAYVHVLQVLPGGTPVALFSAAAGVTLEPGVAARVPPAPDERYELDEVTGTETIYVVASRAPVAAVDAALAAEIRAIQSAPAPAASAPPVGSAPTTTAGSAAVAPPRAQPPPRPRRMLTMANRGLRKVAIMAGRPTVTTVVPIAGEGLVVAWFSFHHER